MTQTPRIAFTSTGPYVGVSTLALKFVHHGFQYVSMSDVMVKAFARQIGSTPVYVRTNKAHYRHALQRFGDESGFSVLSGSWPQELFRGVDMTKPIIMEKVRTNEQAHILTALWFDIIMIKARPETQVSRAANFGVSMQELDEIMKHPVEHAIKDAWVDCEYYIDKAGDDTDWLVDAILNREGDGC